MLKLLKSLSGNVCGNVPHIHGGFRKPPHVNFMRPDISFKPAQQVGFKAGRYNPIHTPSIQDWRKLAGRK